MKRTIGRLAVVTVGVVLASLSGLSVAAGSPAPALPAVVPGVGEVTAPPPGHTRHLHIPITLSAPTPRTVRVHWTTLYVPGAPPVGEPEALASDYRAASGVAVIPAGQTTGAVTVSVTGDAANQFEFFAP
jgi:hypothetical protein